jgi:AraC family transcriptional activator of mtrCDE
VIMTDQVSNDLRTPISRRDLETLIDTLEVRFVALTECVVSPGYSLRLDSHAEPGIHYNLTGRGRALLGDGPPIALAPHTMLIVPPFRPLTLQPVPIDEPLPALRAVDGRLQKDGSQEICRVTAGTGDPEIILICGFFHASYGSTTELFATLSAPIVEQFRMADHIDQTLRAALDELVAQEVGAHAMSASLLKQVLVKLLRRSLVSAEIWQERFAMLQDAQIARALAEMTAQPGGPHTVASLARSAGVSRSLFVARFAELMGRPPMSVLRDLRMRQAAQQLTASDCKIEQIASEAGYKSRSSFVRAFRRAFSSDPSEFRALARNR